MKCLILTKHGIERYASRTARDINACAMELVCSIRNQSAEVSYDMAIEQGFAVTRRYKGDSYHMWYDPKVNDDLLAIITKDGAIKTVLRKEIYSYTDPTLKDREDNHRKGLQFEYGHESRRIKSRRRRSNSVSRVPNNHKR